MNMVTKSILEKNKYAVLSTVREDGSPWGTPVHFAHDGTNIYWLANDDTIHSINIARDNRVFLIVFNSNQVSEGTAGERGALYIATRAYKVEGADAEKAKKVFMQQHSGAKSHKLGDWSVFRAPIGELNPAKTFEDRIYYKFSEETGT